jgi:ubiquinone/menaquinone biosynthesis C-methylase UbiE
MIKVKDVVDQVLYSKKIKESLALSLSVSRSLLYAAESFSLPALDLLANGHRTRPKRSRQEMIEDYSYLIELLKRDSQNIADGIYPLEVLKSPPGLAHFLRFSKVLWDGIKLARRRGEKKHDDFSVEAQEFLGEMPEYYRRNFHFQSSGYLSRWSAEIYDHQVDILFSGASDAMRRLILPPMRRHFGPSKGQQLKFLEIGVGTGRATRFVHMTYPKARIVACDLSDPYLKKAQEQLQDLPRIDFVYSDGASLPFQDESFDAVYSVFLFHELPSEVRHKVLRDSFRVLKPGGFLGLVDSIQKNDNPNFNWALEQFPKDFHEPYFKNYIDSRMEAYLQEYPLEGVSTEIGFLSKVCWGKKKST